MGLLKRILGVLIALLIISSYANAKSKLTFNLINQGAISLTRCSMMSLARILTFSQRFISTLTHLSP